MLLMTGCSIVAVGLSYRCDIIEIVVTGDVTQTSVYRYRRIANDGECWAAKSNQITVGLISY